MRLLSKHAPPASVNSSSVSGISTVSPRKRDYRFKYIILCLCLTLFLSALEFISVSTALPTIVSDLKGDQFIWVTSSYALASAAVIPLIGGLAEIFGRKPTTLLVIFCFASGSAICGAAQSMSMLIIGRTIQGLGGGAIVVVTNIVLADMVPLEERGGYGDVNLPVCGISFILAAVYMKLPKPPGTWREKLTRIDWIYLRDQSLDYIPVYFQSVKLKNPLLSGVLSLGLTVIALFAVLGGISVKIFKIYRPQIWFGWCLQIIGAGLLTSIQYDNAKTVGYCVIFGAGAGINYAAQYYPIQSSLPIETNAQALAFHGFSRSFAATLTHRTKDMGRYTRRNHSTNQTDTNPTLRNHIRSRNSVLSAVGFLSSLAMEDVRMHIHTDKKWNPNAEHHYDDGSGSTLEQQGNGVGFPPMSSFNISLNTYDCRKS
ncbi:hypothetical protein Clacol_008636 [Clathrus columnatus]|uniref:Major facilitator superfamily (MFS) profile domain-containing protein n=1 Tax=Clathrus columnatus TaxID=1419009 RepID=A0AAV5AIA0_9AGAM|nr:hypothetical protein Clacol_008636 [Clathrus columnatus]